MRSEPLILAFDTSAAHCAAALVSGADVLAQVYEDMARGQAERLVPLLEEMLRAAGADWHRLDALAVGLGPGNFTGIRISVAAARGLALGLGIPAIGVSVFEARAEGLARPLSVVEDARRNAVYLQTFDPDPGPARLLDMPEAAASVTGMGMGVVTGTAAEALSSLTGAVALPSRYELAEAIARVAQRKSGSPQPRPAPLYIRAADAAPPTAQPSVFLP